MKKLRFPMWYLVDILCALALVLLLCVAAVPLYGGRALSGELINEELADPEATPTEEPLRRIYTVVVDVGHGGVDGGAIGTKTGVVEAGLNLSVANKVRAELETQGVTVIMTREDENALASGKKADMQARKKIMCQENVDVVVSIHMNKFKDASVKGPMAFYMKGSQEGEKLAESVIKAVCKSVGSAERKANPGDYYVIRESAVPAVLVECGFLSNSTEELLLQDEAYQQKLAEGITQGVVAYLESTNFLD